MLKSRMSPLSFVRSLFRRDIYFHIQVAAPQRQGHILSNTRLDQQAVQFIDALQRCIVESHEDVALLQPCAMRRTAAFHAHHQHARGMTQILPAESQIRAADMAVFNQLPRHDFGRVDGNGKTDALGRQNDGGIHADHFASRVEQRSTRIAWIKRGIRLDHVVN